MSIHGVVLKKDRWKHLVLIANRSEQQYKFCFVFLLTLLNKLIELYIQMCICSLDYVQKLWVENIPNFPVDLWLWGDEEMAHETPCWVSSGSRACCATRCWWAVGLLRRRMCPLPAPSLPSTRAYSPWRVQWNSREELWMGWTLDLRFEENEERGEELC